jgi:hypothetical protein
LPDKTDETDKTDTTNEIAVPKLVDAPPIRSSRWRLPSRLVMVAIVAAVGTVVLSIGAVAHSRSSNSSNSSARPATQTQTTSAQQILAVESSATTTIPSEQVVDTTGTSDAPTSGTSSGSSGGGNGQPAAPVSDCIHHGTVDLTQTIKFGSPTGADLPATAAVSVRLPGQGVNALCPGEQVAVFWATYDGGSDHVSRLYRSQVYYLSEQNPSVQLQIVAPNSCTKSWYIGHGSDIAGSFSEGATPYVVGPGGLLQWNNPSFAPCSTGIVIVTAQPITSPPIVVPPPPSTSAAQSPSPSSSLSITH